MPYDNDAKIVILVQFIKRKKIWNGKVK